MYTSIILLIVIRNWFSYVCSIFLDGKHRPHFCIFHAFIKICNQVFNHISVNITYLHVRK